MRRGVRVGACQCQQAIDESRESLDLLEHAAECVARDRGIVGGAIAQRDFRDGAHRRQRRAQLVRRVGREAPQSIERRLEPSEHAVERDGHAVELVGFAAYRQSLAQAIDRDALRGLGQHAHGRQQSAGEPGAARERDDQRERPCDREDRQERRQRFAQRAFFEPDRVADHDAADGDGVRDHTQGADVGHVDNGPSRRARCDDRVQFRPQPGVVRGAPLRALDTWPSRHLDRVPRDVGFLAEFVRELRGDGIAAEFVDDQAFDATRERVRLSPRLRIERTLERGDDRDPHRDQNDREHGRRPRRESHAHASRRGVHGGVSPSTKPTPRSVWSKRCGNGSSTFLRSRAIWTSMTLSIGVARPAPASSSPHTSRASIARETT
jgi:hypothetical protein